MYRRQAGSDGRPGGRPLGVKTLTLVGLCVLGLLVRGAVRVGYYEDPPLVFSGRDGPQGLYVDLLSAVATAEGWELEYVPCQWPECLLALERGDIDLLPAIAYTEERATRYDFTSETVVANWGQLYVRPGAAVESPLDLEGLRLAGVSEDVYFASFLSLLEKLGVEVKQVPAVDYQDVLAKVEAGEADAGIVARLFGRLHARNYRLVDSPVLCCPVELRMAAPRGLHPELLATLDAYLSRWKADPGSIYFRALDRWLGALTPQSGLPRWLWTFLAALVGGVTLMTLFVVLLRIQVRRRTRELAAERELIDTILNTQATLVVLLDMGGRIVMWNKACERLTRYHLNEVAGKPFWEFVPPEEKDWARGAFANLEGGKLPGHFRTHWRSKGGEDKLIEWDNSVIRGPGGRAEYLVVTGVDITELVTIEGALGESEARLRAVLEQVGIGIFFTDERGRVVLWNRMLAELTGVPEEEAVGEMVWDMQYQLLPEAERTPERYRELKRELLEALATGRPPSSQSRDWEYTKQDGRRLQLRGTTFVIPTPHGRALGTVIRDVTEENEARRRLAESEARYRAVFEGAGDAVLLLQGDRFLDVNPAGEKLFGADREEIVGTTPWHWSPPRQPDGRPSQEAALERIGRAMGGELQRFKWTHLRRDGTEILTEVTLSPIAVQGKRLILALVRDIPPRRTSPAGEDAPSSSRP